MTGRNDPCWCGSGSKYKKCHMAADMASGASAARRVPTAPASWAKSAAEIEGMRRAGAFNGELMDYVRGELRPGLSTEAIDRLVYDYTVSHGHKPATLGYHGFPRSLCTSINDVVCHGIPSPSEVLREGDIVNIDLTTIVDGFHGDSSETFLMGEVSDEAKLVSAVAAESMVRGLRAIQPGRELQDIARAIQPFVEERGFSVVRQYTGHGIGLKFHENFSVFHHVEPAADNMVLIPGMTFTVEPMVNVGTPHVTTDPVDKWTVRTRDKKLSAQFEHTVLVTENGVEILTLTPSQRKAGVWLSPPWIELAAAL